MPPSNYPPRHALFPNAPPPQAGSPLSSEQLQQLARARHAARRIRRAVGVARASAWTTGVFGAITLLGVLMGDATSLVLGGALIAIGVREGRLAGSLSRFVPGSPGALAVNQLVLGTVILLYAAAQVWFAFHSTGLSAANQPVGDAKVDAILNDIGGLTRRITIAFYMVVALGGAAATSLMALFYHRRTRQVREFVSSTSPWVVDVMRTAA